MIYTTRLLECWHVCIDQAGRLQVRQALAIVFLCPHIFSLAAIFVKPPTTHHQHGQLPCSISLPETGERNSSPRVERGFLSLVHNAPNRYETKPSSLTGDRLPVVPRTTSPRAPAKKPKCKEVYERVPDVEIPFSNSGTTTCPTSVGTGQASGKGNECAGTGEVSTAGVCTCQSPVRGVASLGLGLPETGETRVRASSSSSSSLETIACCPRPSARCSPTAVRLLSAVHKWFMTNKDR